MRLILPGRSTTLFLLQCSHEVFSQGDIIMKHGKVYLVGAGPGAPGLITVKGLECLRKADVVIYDRLIDDSLLEESPSKAERIYVGKGRDCHAVEQKEINLLMVSKAREGKTVVRLKGGDPFVLGRGGEEAEVLAANRIVNALLRRRGAISEHIFYHFATSGIDKYVTL